MRSVPKRRGLPKSELERRRVQRERLRAEALAQAQRQPPSLKDMKNLPTREAHALERAAGVNLDDLIVQCEHEMSEFIEVEASDA